MRTGPTIQGLTTSTGLWLVTAIGLAAGGGMYVESVTATTLGIITLTLLRRFEDKEDHLVQRRLSLTLTDAAPRYIELVERIKPLCARVIVEEWEKDRGHGKRRLVLSARLPRQGGEEQLAALLDAEPAVERMHIAPSP